MNMLAVDASEKGRDDDDDDCYQNMLELCDLSFSLTWIHMVFWLTLKLIVYLHMCLIIAFTRPDLHQKRMWNWLNLSKKIVWWWFSAVMWAYWWVSESTDCVVYQCDMYNDGMQWTISFSLLPFVSIKKYVHTRK